MLRVAHIMHGENKAKLNVPPNVGMLFSVIEDQDETVHGDIKPHIMKPKSITTVKDDYQVKDFVTNSGDGNRLIDLPKRTVVQ